MSEMRVIDLGNIRESIENGESVYYEYYAKSEVYKAIVELKQKINEVHTELELWRDGYIISEVHLKELRHNKYKRCLAMAMWCKRKRIDAADYRIPRQKWDFYDKWHKRWLELAEKFKHKNGVNNG